MLHEKIYSKVRVGLPLTYSWGAVRLHKVTQTNENGYTKLHKGAVVTQRQKSRYLQRTDEIKKF